MGVILLLFLVAGVALGGLVALPLGIIAVLIASRTAPTRRYVWPTTLLAGGAFALAFVALLHGGLLQLEDVKPGSDYDAVASNFLRQGFAYTAAVGLAAALGALVSLRCPLREEAASRSP